MLHLLLFLVVLGFGLYLVNTYVPWLRRSRPSSQFSW